MSLAAMDQVLVLGGTGFVGRSVCEVITSRIGGAGTRLMVPTRQLQRARSVQYLPTVDVVLADLSDDTQLRRLVAGSDAVVNLVGRLHGSAEEFDATHVGLPRRLAEACRATGVRRVVHVSALGVSADAPSRYLRSKFAGEAVLRDASLDVTVLRPSVMFGAGDHFMNLFAGLQGWLPVMPLGGADSRMQPVWVEDVAAAIANVLDRRDTAGKTFELAGPQVLTLAELVRRAGAWSGHPRPVFGLPGPLASAQALVMECLPGEPLISRDNLASLRVDNVASGSLPGLADLHVDAAALDAVMPLHLARRDSVARLEPWRRNAGR